MRLPDKFKLKYFFSAILTALIICSVTWSRPHYHIVTPNFDRPLTGDTIKDTLKPRPPRRDTTPRIEFKASDTIPVAGSDSLSNDTLPAQKVDTFSLKLSKDTLDAPVNYYAEDSAVVLIQSKKIILYGKTETKYKDVTLKAPVVELDQQTQVMTAFNKKDSTGEVVEGAEFTQADNKFTSDTIRYNFKTQKGLTKNTITQQGEMYVHAERAKKVDDATTFVSRGFFTTCNLDHPHFGFRANKIKMINKKLAVSGPAHPEFEEVPVPIYLPFGFFPLSQGRHSGFLPPTFATNETFGLGLEGLGYYKVINDYWDVQVRGNVYSYGGWQVNVIPSYRKRYKYSGDASFGLISTKRNFKGDPDFQKTSSYRVTWRHASDSRARPGTSFSASVDASSTNYNTNVQNNPNLNFTNAVGSSIAYSKTWQGKPYNLTMSANHSQNNQARQVSISLPDAGFTVTTIYPFQKKESVGNKKWYEQLGIGYQGNFRNSVTFYDSINYRQRYGKSVFAYLLDTLQWGAQHSIPITLSLPPILGGAIVVAPSVSYSQVWVNQKRRYTWKAATETYDTMVTKGFFVDQQASFALSFNTAVYGMYQFNRKKLVAIRHVIRPTFGLNYKPNTSKNYFYTQQVRGYTVRYGELEGGQPYSGYGYGKNAGISFGIDNNVEMKVRSDKDSVDGGTKKIRLIDALSVTSSYNFLADSLTPKLSPFILSFRTNLFEKINLSAGGTLDPYVYNLETGRPFVGRYVWQEGKFSPGRLSTANISLSTQFQSKPKDPEKDAKKQEQLKTDMRDPLLAADQQRLMDYMRQNPAEFVDFNIPWSFSISYSLFYGNNYNVTEKDFDKTLNSTASFNGSFNLTPKWNFSVNGFYDLTTRKLQTFSMAISRDMHCWQMAINVTPVGLYPFFNFTISPKSGILQDLKVNRSRSFIRQ